MLAFGANLIVIPSEGGKITPGLIPSMRAKARELADRDGTYATDQFNNRDALIGYSEIGRELLAQVDGPIGAFCGAVGVGGMLIGVASALREGGSTARIVALEPAGSPFLTTGRAGTHHVEGTGAGFMPPLLKDGGYDEARAIDEDEGRAMARRLAREEGIFAGVSTGLNVVGAIGLARELGPGKTVATVAVDSGLKYLSGDLYQS
jgi:cysteine synthase